MSQISDPIGDFLTRLRNAAATRNAAVKAPYSKIKAEIARILKQEGYITDYEVDTTGKFPEIKVATKVVNRSSSITGIKRVSKPGLRRYVASDEIPARPRRHGRLDPFHSPRHRHGPGGQEAKCRRRIAGHRLVSRTPL